MVKDELKGGGCKFLEMLKYKKKIGWSGIATW
jgi:hypothetical protein